MILVYNSQNLQQAAKLSLSSTSSSGMSIQTTKPTPAAADLRMGVARPLEAAVTVAVVVVLLLQTVRK